MLLPEGTIVIVSPILGCFLDRLSLNYKLRHFLSLSHSLTPHSLSLPHSISLHIHTHTLSNSLTLYSVLAAATGVMSISYLCLLYGYDNDYVKISPYFSMSLLGFAYSFSNCIFWSNLNIIIPKNSINEASGLLASLMNLLPTVVPLVVPVIGAVVVKESSDEIICLYILALLGSFLITRSLTHSHDDVSSLTDSCCQVFGHLILL